jgi:hypothetical protein
MLTQQNIYKVKLKWGYKTKTLAKTFLQVFN